MISKWHWLILQFTRKLWVRATLLAILGVVSALAAIALESYFPAELPGEVGADAVDGILEMLASSMLAVTTFSLSVMVAAYASATSNVTPRATKLLMQDSTTQNVLATFIGSFLFSLVGLIALSMGAYGQQGRVVLFVVTIAVIVLIVVTILRWIDHLSRLGRVGETTERVEQAANKALIERAADPCLGAHPLDDLTAIPNSAIAVSSERVGYIEHVDLHALAGIAEDCECDFYIVALPGTFVHPARPLLWVTKSVPKVDELRKAFTIGDERNFDQDPRFGLVVLAEIGSRALSPAVNDPGTAIDVIGRGVRLMAIWHKASVKSTDINFKRLWISPLRIDDMFQDLFASIARDGAAMIEVQVRLQKALLALAELGDKHYRKSAYRVSRIALERAEAAISIDAEKQEMRDIANEIVMYSGGEN